jgi:hypothetical protein
MDGASIGKKLLPEICLWRQLSKPRANLLTAEADFNVKKMAQRRSGHHRREQNAEQISHPKLGWIRSSD